MTRKWHKTQYRGVEYREHPTRKHGIMRDRYWRIRFQYRGKMITSGLGWSSEGWTPLKAVKQREIYRENARAGKGPVSWAEEQEINQAEKERREREKRLAEIRNITFDDFWEVHYLPAQHDKNPSTLSTEKGYYKKWIMPDMGQKSMKDISPMDVERIKRNMSRAGRAPRTVHYVLQIIRQVFNLALELNIFSGENPVARVKRPKYDNKRLRFLSYEEAEQLLDTLKERSRITYSMAVLSLHCGLRAGEVMTLTWGDVDLEHGLLTLRDTKSGKSRKVYMTDLVKEILSGMDRGGKADYVFPDRNGNRRRFISKTFDRAVELLGFNDGVTDRRQRVTFHTLRHSFASWTVMSGTDIYVLKEILGHSTLAMTERYSHLAPEKFKVAAQAFQDGLDKAKKVVEFRNGVK